MAPTLNAEAHTPGRMLTDVLRSGEDRGAKQDAEEKRCYKRLYEPHCQPLDYQ